MELCTIQELIAKQFGIESEDITEQTNFLEDLHATSMDVVDLIVELEDRESITIPDEIVDHGKSVGEILAYLQALEAEGRQS